jgi:hypothetical protein
VTAPLRPSEPPPEPPAYSWGALLFIAVSIVIGIAYLYWVTAIEGWRVWVIVGLMALTAGCAALAHWMMGRTRR